MNIANYIKHALDSLDRRELEPAMLFVCLAVDGTAKKKYPSIQQVGTRFKQFIRDNIDIIELMFGGINLSDTSFPIPDKKGNIGMKYEDLIYEKFRCSLAHGDMLEEGYGVEIQMIDGSQSFIINLKEPSMTLPESSIVGLALACVLAEENADQKIGNNAYYIKDSINTYVVDRWWGKVICAKGIMDLDNLIRVHLNFSEDGTINN